MEDEGVCGTRGEKLCEPIHFSFSSYDLFTPEGVTRMCRPNPRANGRRRLGAFVTQFSKKRSIKCEQFNLILQLILTCFQYPGVLTHF